MNSNFFLKCCIKFIYFFTSTLLGYGIYLFISIYGFFGCENQNCRISHVICASFALFIFFFCIIFYILIKIPTSRKFIYKTVGEEFIVKYLGKNTMSLVAMRAAIPILAPVVADMASGHLKHYQNMYKAEHIMQEHIKACELSNKPFDMESPQYKEAAKKADYYRQADSSGLITSTIKSEASRDMYNKTVSSISQLKWWSSK